MLSSPIAIRDGILNFIEHWVHPVKFWGVFPLLFFPEQWVCTHHFKPAQVKVAVAGLPKFPLKQDYSCASSGRQILFLSSQEKGVKRECLWVFGFGLHRIGQFVVEIVEVSSWAQVLRPNFRQFTAEPGLCPRFCLSSECSSNLQSGPSD